MEIIIQVLNKKLLFIWNHQVKKEQLFQMMIINIVLKLDQENILFIQFLLKMIRLLNFNLSNMKLKFIMILD